MSLLLPFHAMAHTSVRPAPRQLLDRAFENQHACRSPLLALGMKMLLGQVGTLAITHGHIPSVLLVWAETLPSDVPYYGTQRHSRCDMHDRCRQSCA